MNWKMVLGVLIIFSVFVSGSETPVSSYGALVTKDSEIVSKLTDDPVQLRGVSLGSANLLLRSNQFYNIKTITYMVDSWKAEMIRFPLEFTNAEDYIADSSVYSTLFDGMIDACITKGIYVVVTWRSSSLEQNSEEKSLATHFFSRLAKKYGTSPNLIFEIFERPESSDWADIKETQHEIISEIRKNSNQLIIVGTPSLSQDVELITASPLNFSNVVYSFQFNAGSEIPTGLSLNGKTFQQKINLVLDAELPVFVSQFTTMHFDGGLDEANHYNTHDSLSALSWLSFLDSKGISYIAGTVSDEYLGSAFFGIDDTPKFDQTVAANWSNQALMTPSGRFIYNQWLKYAFTAPWRTESSSSVAISSSSSVGPLTSLIDDFTDGNTAAFTKEYWYIYTDVDDNGKSTVENTKSGTTYKVVFDDGTGNKAATIQNFTLVKGSNTNDPYVALGLNAINNGSMYSLEECDNGFSYRYKGAAHRFHAKMSTVTDFNYHFTSVPAKTVWTEVIVSLSDFEQESWGEEVSFEPAFIESFSWEVKKTPTSGSLWVDDFYCLGSDLGLQSSSSSAPKSSSSQTSSSSQVISSSSEMPLSSSSVSSQISLIDDFTDGNTAAFTKEYWYIYTDVDDKGQSTVENTKSGTSYKIVFDDGTGNKAASIQNFILVKGSNTNDPYVALGLNTAKNGSAYLLKKCVNGFSYRYKGVAHRFQAKISTVTDYNYHFTSVPAKTVWTEIIVSLSDFEQDSSWGEEVAFNPAFIQSFSWEVKKTPTTGTLWIDDFTCLGGDLGIQPSSSSVAKSSSSSGTISIANTKPFVKWRLVENGRSLAFTFESENSAWLDLFDMQGNLVISTTRIGADKHIISLEMLPSGNYAARVRTTEKQMMIPLRIR